MNTFYPVFMTIFKQTHESHKDLAKTPEKFDQAQKKQFMFPEISD
ncbi:hypothetical protein BDGGKGIB_02171 [Nodularia sphaerocarpa UHCC 0038]|nr:hypothetical protein BDGGKGIB_02171 [Nodularia sphaerocarpa UHCC 0038]